MVTSIDPSITGREAHARARIAQLGTLAAGVAHEINNPLTYVMAGLDQAIADVDALLGAVPALGVTRATLREVRDGAERAWLIARDVRMFSRREADGVGPVDLGQVLDATVRVAGHDVRARATLVQEFAGMPPVMGSAVLLGQVFLNLLINAAQAVPAGDPEAHRICLRGSEDGDRVRVAVSDTGGGIPAELRGQIFDPFFTTKPAGEGTGLGLAITHEIVTSLGGTITVESEVGRGTTFTVSLWAQPREGPRASHPPARAGRVLVIDDDPLVAEAVRLALAPENDVVVATAGADALALLGEGEGFDTIFCDLMMPGMDGTQFYDEVARRAEAATEAIAFLSGGVDDAATEAFLARTGRPVMEKPFDPASLRKYVRGRVRLRAE